MKLLILFRPCFQRLSHLLTPYVTPINRSGPKGQFQPVSLENIFHRQFFAISLFIYIVEKSGRKLWWLIIIFVIYVLFGSGGENDEIDR